MAPFLMTGSLKMEPFDRPLYYYDREQPLTRYHVTAFFDTEYLKKAKKTTTVVIKCEWETVPKLSNIAMDRDRE